MTASARFKFYFHLDDELLSSTETKEQLYYTYSEAAPVQCVPMKKEDHETGRKARMVLRGLILNHSFWLSSDPEADEMFDRILVPRIAPTIERTVRHQRMYLAKQDKQGIPLEPFDRLDLMLDPYVFSFEDTLHLKESTVTDSVKAIRSWLNDGTFDPNRLARIDIPAASLVEDGGNHGEAASAGSRKESCAEDAADEEIEIVDYAVWEVFFRDGSSRLFDSSSGSWLEQKTVSEPIRSAGLPALAV